MRVLAPVVVLLLMAACSKPDNASGPGSVSVGEAKALDEAAEMLDANRTPEGAGQQAAPQGTQPPQAGKAPG